MGDVMTAEATSTPKDRQDGRARARLRHLIPVSIFAALALVLAWDLTHNSRNIPSALIGKPVRPFSLLPVQARTLVLSSADLAGDVPLVSVFASWCVACREERPLLMRLKAAGVAPIHGLKHRPDNAAPWLNTLGHPYRRTGADRDGRVAIEWGVYGVPETFFVTREGVSHTSTSSPWPTGIATRRSFPSPES